MTISVQIVLLYNNETYKMIYCTIRRRLVNQHSPLECDLYYVTMDTKRRTLAHIQIFIQYPDRIIIL